MKIEWPEKVTNEKVLELTGEKRTYLNNILRTKAIGLNIFEDCLLLDVIKGKITAVKGVGR
jgi:hypothetical protein